MYSDSLSLGIAVSTHCCICQQHASMSMPILYLPSRQVGVIYDIPLKELRLFTDYGRTR